MNRWSNGPYGHAGEVPGGSRQPYISGEVGVRRHGFVPDDIEAQAECGWQNPIAIPADAGMEVSDLVKITTYLPRSKDVEAAGADRAKYFWRCPAPTGHRHRTAPREAGLANRNRGGCGKGGRDRLGHLNAYRQAYSR